MIFVRGGHGSVSTAPTRRGSFRSPPAPRTYQEPTARTRDYVCGTFRGLASTPASRTTPGQVEAVLDRAVVTALGAMQCAPHPRTEERERHGTGSYRPGLRRVKSAAAFEDTGWLRSST